MLRQLPHCQVSIILSPFSMQCQALQLAGPRVQGSMPFVLAAVEADPKAFRYADEFWGHKDVVLAAVNGDGRALTFATPELQDDVEVVLAAVRQVDVRSIDSLIVLCDSTRMHSSRHRTACGITRNPVLLVLTTMIQRVCCGRWWCLMQCVRTPLCWLRLVVRCGTTKRCAPTRPV